MYELMIEHEGRIRRPAVLDGVTLEQERQGSPGKLTFSAVVDQELKAEEGDRVSLQADGTGLFCGFIFERKQGKGGKADFTAYDQIRYLKYKDSYGYENKTAGEVIRMVAEDHGLAVGELAETGYRIPGRTEENKTLLDVIYNAMTLTTLQTGGMYLFYDDYGKLTLNPLSSMLRRTGICGGSAEDFEYSSGIDGETYNRIKLDLENGGSGGTTTYLAEDKENIRRWGILQYYEKIKDGRELSATAGRKLARYNKKTQKLWIKGALGSVEIRAGCLMPVLLELEGMTINQLMLVEKAVHRFEKSGHQMDLTLRGGGFSV